MQVWRVCVLRAHGTARAAFSRHTKDVFRILISKATSPAAYTYRVRACARNSMTTRAFTFSFFSSTSLFLFLFFSFPLSSLSLPRRLHAFALFVIWRVCKGSTRRSWESPVLSPGPFQRVALHHQSVSPLESAFIAGLRRIAPPGRYANERREWRTTLNTSRSLGNVCNIN